MENLKEILTNHLVFKDMKPGYIDFLVGCAIEKEFPASIVVFRTGEPADEFYLVESGEVALEVYAPPKGSLSILTLSSHDVVGWSWLYPPHTWHFQARARSDIKVYAFDAAKLRQECEQDYEFGYMLTRCFGKIMVQRLAATRLQLMDVYRS